MAWGNVRGGEFRKLCTNFVIVIVDFAPAKSPGFTGVAEQGLGITDWAAAAARIQAGVIFLHVHLSPTDSLAVGGGDQWACKTLTVTA